MNFLKNVLSQLFHLPATALSGIANLLLGSEQQDKFGNKEIKPGLFGYIGSALRQLSKFVANHKTAIAVAIWAALFAAGAAALTVALWPAALAAVTTFSVGGFTIAALVGTGFAAQVGAVAGITAALTLAGVLPAATLVSVLKDGVQWAMSKFKKADTAQSGTSYEPIESYSGASDALRVLGSRIAEQEPAAAPAPAPSYPPVARKDESAAPSAADAAQPSSPRVN